MRAFFSILCLFLLASPVRAEIDFAHEVVPILQESCVECHGGEKAKGGFSMDTRSLFLDADVVELGDPDKSIFIQVLTDPDPDYRMPPPHKKEALKPEQIKVLRKWVADGLQWEAGFAFGEKKYEAPLKPRRVDLPDSDTNPLDQVVLEHLRKTGVKPPERIDDREFLRRVTLDLTGVPPKLETVAALPAEGSLDRDAVVDRLLADDRSYAEHWMTFWNDLLRNEYIGTGYIEGGRRQVTGWLYRSLLENKPYDQFVKQLVAPDDESRGFIKGIKWRGEVNASQTTEIQFSQNVSQVFLGINMKCASCHDSFTDRWTLEEAYGLAAIYSEKPLELVRCDKPTGKQAVASWIYPELGEIDPEKPRDQRLEQLAELIVHPDNGRTQRTIVNRLWNQMMGRGIVHPVDAMSTEPWNADLLDVLANHLVDTDYDLREVLRLIATSRTYQSRSEVRSEDEGTYVFEGPVRKRMTAEQFVDSVRSVTGVWPEPEKSALRERGLTGGQLRAVMAAHNLEEWDGRPVRAVLASRDNLQAALGRPNREQIVTSRPDILTTLEAINLANGPELSGLLREASERIDGDTGPHELVEQVYLAALTRRPTPAEMRIATGLLGDSPTVEAREDFLWSVFLLPEFIYIN